MLLEMGNIMPFKPSRRRTFLKALLLAALFLTSGHRESFANESEVNRQIDMSFVEWSNSIPEEQAKIQLQRILVGLGSAEQAREWLIARGFRVEKPRQMNEHVAAKFRQERSLKKIPVYTFVAGWDVRRKGIIFESNFISRQIARHVFYGVSIEVTYTNDAFDIHRITITRSSL